jgi:NTE family protein
MTSEEIALKIARMEEDIKAREREEKENSKSSLLDLGADYALCLGGGGGKGSYQLGVYKALAEYGLFDRIKAISGSSIGAINALLFSQLSPDKAEKVWQEIDFDTLFSADTSLMFNDKPGFMSRNEMFALMDRYIDYSAMKDGGIKVYATIAKQISEYDFAPEYVCVNDLSPEDTKKIIAASSAMPYVYESVDYNGSEYIDGGMADNLPVAPLYDAGYRHIILCGLNENSKKNLEKYSDADFVEIYPSAHLGDLLDGTLDFSADSLVFRSMLGYKDALRALKVHFERNPDYIAALDYYKANDLAEIKAEIKRRTSEGNISGTMDNVNRILKYAGENVIK